MMKATILASAALVCCAANARPREFYEAQFFDHIKKYNLKSVVADGKEFIKRLQIFADNFDAIEAHNAKGETYTMGLNQFSHLTFEEFKEAVHLGSSRPPNLRRAPDSTNPLHESPVDVSALPTSIDWTAKGAVTNVKDQGNCGSCWSFSTTGALEGAYFLKYGTLLSFSEQQLVSCDTTDLGCNGGWMDDAFTWVKGNGGLTTEDQYPYTSGTTGNSGVCQKTGYTNNANVAPKSFTDVKAGDVNALMSAVAQQPVSIAIQANQLAFQSYSSGVLTGKCGQRLDHGVLAVGYGTLNGVDYWKVKNSWGPSWGQDGYILIERSSADLCGVLDAASYPTL